MAVATMPKIKFENNPISVLKLRSDSLSFIKGNDQKCISLRVTDLGTLRCKIVIQLLLKEPNNVPHFYHLCDLSSKRHVMEIEHELMQGQSIVKLDFFGVKKSLKKEAMSYLREHCSGDIDVIYKTNLSTIVLHITLVDSTTNFAYNVLPFEFTDKEQAIVVRACTPHTLVSDDSSFELTFLLEKSEMDTESIYLELNIENKTSLIRPKDLPKIKNVFIFNLKKMDRMISTFSGRICRRGSTNTFSEWQQFRIIDSRIETVKRKITGMSDNVPQRKIPRCLSIPISENSLSDVNLSDYLSSPSSSFSVSSMSSKSNLKDIFQTRVFSAIARVGHDYAFGRVITENMRNITKKLPIVYILQDDVGDTPLHNAILQNHEDRAIEILNIVKKNFPNDLFTKNTSNHTALILAPACNVSPDFVQLLIYYGFNISDKDIDGNTALDIAIEYKNTNVLKTLVKNAIISDAFKDDRSEIKSLVKKTLLTKYFDGYKILMMSELNMNFNCHNLDLDSESAQIFNMFSQKLNNRACNDQLPDEGYTSMLDQLLNDHDEMVPLPELSLEEIDDYNWDEFLAKDEIS